MVGFLVCGVNLLNDQFNDMSMGRVDLISSSAGRSSNLIGIHTGRSVSSRVSSSCRIRRLGRISSISSSRPSAAVAHFCPRRAVALCVCDGLVGS